MKPTLTLSDTSLLKGFAICCIILHNFCHQLPGCVLENEYSFFPDRTWKLFHFYMNGGPHVILNTFSYFGHYGVPLFLFVSGYGLVRKYESNVTDRVGTGRFMAYNALKLWRLLVPGVILFALSDLFIHHGVWNHHWYDVVSLLSYTSNIVYDHDNLMGPWWYFSLTLQCYLIYRLFLYRRGKEALLIVAGLCLLTEVVAFLVDGTKGDVISYVRYNFMGEFLPFAAGVWMARYGLRYSPWFSLLWIALLVASCFSGWSWLLSPLLAALAALPLVRLQGIWRRALCWMGALSSMLFVVHPIVRPYFITWIRRGHPLYLNLIGYLVVSILVALVFRYVIRHIPSPKQA